MNRVTALFEKHHHIVQPVDGGNDFGIDLYVSFVNELETTGDTIAIQVKAGASFRSANGYRVKVGNHHRDWTKPNIPVICIVHDPKTDTLHWANATEQLRSAGEFGSEIRSIEVLSGSVLDDGTLEDFVTKLRFYLSRRTQVNHALAALTGAEIDATDYVSLFVNEYGDVLLFAQSLGMDIAAVYHSQAPGFPIFYHGFGPQEKIDYGQVAWAEESEFVGDFLKNHKKPNRVVLTLEERMWVRLCVHASAWWRETPALQPNSAMQNEESSNSSNVED